MYQFYYTDKKKEITRIRCEKNVRDHFEITAIRPTMWEEHCLECGAPACFETCAHYIARSDGRCMRFDNGLSIFADDKACCGQGVHVKFRKWANMMTIIFPAMLTEAEYVKLFEKNQGLGTKLGKIVSSKLPQVIRWNGIRTMEYIRRKELRGLSGLDNRPDAFVFHGYSYESQSYQLIIEIYDDHTSVFKTSIRIEPGENLFVLLKEQLSDACQREGNLVKVYPENNIEASLDILWCDFVQGKYLTEEKPAEKVKCVVWDLDNTLWDGILIETEDVEKIKLNEGVLDVMKALDERGIVQSIASKNYFEEAWPILERLEISEYFLYPQIHWNAKSESIKQIAEDFNIGIDTLAFIDDSEFERKQVASRHPNVRCYDISVIDSLLLYPEFQVTVTEEGKKRRSMYLAEAKRKTLQAREDSSDLLEFLRKCNLKLTIFAPETEEEKLRCFELITRTNQLNMTGTKYSKEEFDVILNKANHTNFAFSCRDDFGEYGIVGFGQYKVNGEVLEFTEFAMSCRIAGKYVESALFSKLLDDTGCVEGRFAVQKTKKNGLLRNTLEEIGFVITEKNDLMTAYTFNNNLLNKNLVCVGDM